MTDLELRSGICMRQDVLRIKGCNSIIVPFHFRKCVYCEYNPNTVSVERADLDKLIIGYDTFTSKYPNSSNQKWIKEIKERYKS